MQLDSIDKKILEYLQNDSKVTTKWLSLQLNLSSTAVYERIRKLERNGIIEKYSVQLNQEKIGKAFTVFCQIKLIQHKHEFLEKFENQVVLFSEVLECYNVSGDYDYLLKVVVENMEAYHQFLNEKLTRLDYVGSAHSLFIIHEMKNSKNILL